MRVWCECCCGVLLCILVVGLDVLLVCWVLLFVLMIVGGFVGDFVLLAVGLSWLFVVLLGFWMVWFACVSGLGGYCCGWRLFLGVLIALGLLVCGCVEFRVLWVVRCSFCCFLGGGFVSRFGGVFDFGCFVLVYVGGLFSLWVWFARCVFVC